MVVSSRDLAKGLASRLDNVAPDGLSVRASGEQLSVHRGDLLLGGSAASGILDGGSDDRQIETATRSTISAVQDVFAEESKTPWPAPFGRMPVPEARIDGDVLLAWFGSEEKPVLSLAPLGLRR